MPTLMDYNRDNKRAKNKRSRDERTEINQVRGTRIKGHENINAGMGAPSAQ